MKENKKYSGEVFWVRNKNIAIMYVFSDVNEPIELHLNKKALKVLIENATEVLNDLEEIK